MTSDLRLSRRQRDVLYALVRIWDREKIVPTIAELQEATGIRSLRGVTLQLDALERKEYIKRMPGSPRALTILRKTEPSELQRENRRRGETKQLRRFITFMRKVEGVSLRTKAREVSPGDHTKKNYDAQLIGPGGSRWAIELTELYESDEYRRNNAVWMDVIAELKLHLHRWKKVRGAFYISLPLRFEVSRSGVPQFAESLANKIISAIDNMGTASECKIEGIRISRLEGFRGSHCILGGTEAGWIDAPRTMRERLSKAIEEKCEQLSDPDVSQRILVVTNYYHSGDQRSAIDALAQVDLTNFPQVEKLYIEFSAGLFTRVYDRSVIEHLRRADIPSKEPERSLAFDYLLRLIRASSEEAWPVLEVLLDGAEPSRTFPEASMREAIVDLAQSYLKKEISEELSNQQPLTGSDSKSNGQLTERAIRIIERLLDDPDPNREGMGDKNHSDILESEDPKVITSVRGRLCWAIQQLALRKETINKAVDCVVRLLRFSNRDSTLGEKNIYIIQQAIVPLIEIGKRRQLLNDRNRARLSKLVFLLQRYSQFAPIATYFVELLLCYRDLSDRQAEAALREIAPINETASLYLYFGYYREKHLGSGYAGAAIRALLDERISSGTDEFRCELAWQLAEITSKEPQEATFLRPVIDRLAASTYYHSTHLHLGRVAKQIVETHPKLAISIHEKLLSTVGASVNNTVRDGRWLPDNLSGVFHSLLRRDDHQRAFDLLCRMVDAIERMPSAAPLGLAETFRTLSDFLPKGSAHRQEMICKQWQRIRTVLPHIGESWAT